ncbi:MAG: methyltransferase domain-containing protein [Nitrosomonadales bacterium]|nr:methyltransferase domain-containing protein [Nitrosomonadales bacterium]
MWSKTIPHRSYREPYLPRFFQDAARLLPLHGHERLLDIACGTGTVAFGFAPFVSSLTGVDMELPMLENARQHAETHNIDIHLIHSRMEDIPTETGPFDIMVMGKAHWYLDARMVIPKMDALLKEHGKILVCLATAEAPWRATFFQVLLKWAPDFPWGRLDINPGHFFEGSRFQISDKIVIQRPHMVTPDYLVKRAYGYPATPASKLGDQAEYFAADLKQALSPFMENGKLVEKLKTVGFIFSRK